MSIPVVQNDICNLSQPSTSHCRSNCSSPNQTITNVVLNQYSCNNTENDDRSIKEPADNAKNCLSRLSIIDRLSSVVNQNDSSWDPEEDRRAAIDRFEQKLKHDESMDWEF